MELTSLERDMLAGKRGEGVALAMKVQVGTGRAFSAKRMVPVEDGDQLAVDAVAGKIVVRTGSGERGVAG